MKIRRVISSIDDNKLINEIDIVGIQVVFKRYYKPEFYDKIGQLYVKLDRDLNNIKYQVISFSIYRSPMIGGKFVPDEIIYQNDSLE